MKKASAAWVQQPLCPTGILKLIIIIQNLVTRCVFFVLNPKKNPQNSIFYQPWSRARTPRIFFFFCFHHFAFVGAASETVDEQIGGCSHLSSAKSQRKRFFFSFFWPLFVGLGGYSNPTQRLLNSDPFQPYIAPRWVPLCMDNHFLLVFFFTYQQFPISVID